ncbi:unnamed protein product [Linum tenue]|uniref:F-box domain-containing protein n=1 Tax=Linum tenue TaxID=586396 RepID=A0AAV0GPB7_9ROSI|nr:unnamed protein product [Linum tenue]
MSDHLPADVVTRILVRLPVAALLRCRSVSRSWRALIDSPTFIKLQIEHSRRRLRRLPIRKRPPTRNCYHPSCAN